MENITLKQKIEFYSVCSIAYSYFNNESSRLHGNFDIPNASELKKEAQEKTIFYRELMGKIVRDIEKNPDFLAYATTLNSSYKDNDVDKEKQQSTGNYM